MTEKFKVLTPEEADEWRKSHGITLAQIAESVGCDVSLICKLLRGTVKGRCGHAHTAAVALRLKAPAHGEAPLNLKAAGKQRRQSAKKSASNSISQPA